MSCIPEELIKKANTATAVPLSFPNPDLMDKLLRTLGDDDAYESDEPRPSQKLVTYVAILLGSLNYRSDIEIYPHSGDINVTWRNKTTSARVKATFGSDGVMKIYSEQMLLGKVSDNRLIAKASPADLDKALGWLYSAR